jgi:CxxC motif-containing protein (DUF1111 family)
MLAVCALSKAASEPGPGYFGESIGGLTPVQQASFERGFRLFVKTWSEGQGYARNAQSCLECHNTPMPGGSGIAPSTLVIVDESQSAGSRLQFVQRKPEPAPPIISAVPTDTASHAGMRRRTPPLFGIGYLEVERTVPDERTVLPGSPFGAFGKVQNLEDFVSLAFADELGVATPKHCPRRNVNEQYPTKCKADISTSMVSDVTNFIRFLAAPPLRQGRVATNGIQTFVTIGCDLCHVPRAVTRLARARSLSHQPISAYSDSKLHDLGSEPPGLIKTAPLWGLNSVGPPYMHNGLANSIDDAIQLHGGEAAEAARRYRALSAEERTILTAFLRSL